VDYHPRFSPGHPLFADDALHQDPLKVLAALTDPFPLPDPQLLRYLEWYSNQGRILSKKAAQTAAAATALCSSLPAAELLPEPEDTPYRRACQRSWAKFIEKVYLVSPLVCPKCLYPMYIVSFIEDHAVVRIILPHLGIWETPPRPPPKLIVIRTALNNCE
jgi:hypothetical protein